MDDATLERLILDDALGALSPDASALLAAHIKTLPGGSERLAAWRQVADSARSAMPTEAVADLPPFPVHGMTSNPWRISRIGLLRRRCAVSGVGDWLVVATSTHLFSASGDRPATRCEPGFKPRRRT